MAKDESDVDVKDEVQTNLDELDAMFEAGELDIKAIEESDVEVLASIDQEHYAFPTKDLFSIVRVLKVIQSTGSNLYDNSALLHRPDPESLNYVLEFCTLGIYYKAVLKSNSPTPTKLSNRRVLLDINSLLAICKYSSNSVVLFPEENAVFAKVLGGRSVVKSYFAVEDKPYEQFRADSAEAQKASTRVTSASIGQALKIATLAQSSGSAYQRVLYFAPEGSYLHTGAVSAHVKTPLVSAAIQPKGVAGLRFFMKDAPVEINVFSNKRVIGFEFDGNTLVTTQVDVEFPEAIRQVFELPERVTKLSVAVVNGICDLLGFSGALGSLRVTLFPAGARLDSVNKEGGVGSTFSSGIVTDVIPISSVTVNANALKGLIGVMKGNKEVAAASKNNLLLISAENVTAALSGKEG